MYKRVQNPTAQLTLVYSSKCLNASALKELDQFCLKHRITPFDIDTELPSLLKTNNDKKLYDMTVKEISACLSNQGGNMAAASDYARFITPLLEKFCNYSDFDVRIKVKLLPPTIDVLAPLLLPAHLIKSRFSYNNDILLTARDPLFNDKLHSDATAAIETIQDSLIQRYTNNAALLNSLMENYETVCFGLPENTVFKIFVMFYKENTRLTPQQLRIKINHLQFTDLLKSLNYDEKQNIFGNTDLNAFKENELKIAYAKYRLQNNNTIKFTDCELITLVDDYMKRKKHDLMLMSVTRISGPSNVSSLLKHLHQHRNVKKGLPLIQVAQNISIDINYLNDFLITTNKVSKGDILNDPDAFYMPPKQKAEDPFSLYCDLSWLPVGKNNQNKRILWMSDAATKIQSTWKNHKNSIGVSATETKTKKCSV